MFLTLGCKDPEG